MNEARKAGRIFSFLGVLIFSSFWLLDWFFYPDFIWPMFKVRILIAGYLFIAGCIYSRISSRYVNLLSASCFIFGVFAMSYLCFIPGDGFASHYFAGNLYAIIISGAVIYTRKKYYALLLIIMLLEHFILLSLLPFEVKDFILNFLTLIVAAGVSFLIYSLKEQIKVLQGFLPICAQCKQIRDDKGYWHQVETYVHAHSDADFTHSICPECARKLYGEEYADIYNQKVKT